MYISTFVTLRLQGGGRHPLFKLSFIYFINVKHTVQIIFKVKACYICFQIRENGRHSSLYLHIYTLKKGGLVARWVVGERGKKRGN